MKRMSVRQLISLGMALLMMHPALVTGGSGSNPRPPEHISRPITMTRPIAPAAAAAAAPALTGRKGVAAQVVVPFFGETVTTLPDGRVLTLGGQNATGTVGRAALKPAGGIAAQ